MNFLNKNCKIDYYNDPYPYAIIDNFFDQDFYNEIEKNFPLVSEFKKQKNKINRMHYDISHKDKLYDDLIKSNQSFKVLHDYIYSINFIEFFMKIFNSSIQNEITNKNLKDINFYNLSANPFEIEKITSKVDIQENDKNLFLYPRLDLGVGLKGYGKDTGGKGIHVDNPQRLISILLYLGGYNHLEGGELRIWKKELNKLEIANIIKPTPNRLVASLQTNLSFHDVNPVRKINGSRNACYIAISSCNKIWKDIENNEFNKKFHRNRITTNSIIERIKNFFI